MITIDAKNQKIGRVASKVAKILSGKENPAYERNAIKGEAVHIINVAQADVNEKKLTEKRYDRYSGYPGGLKLPTMQNVITKRGMSEVFRLAVYGMLPSNRLRAKLMKMLTITE